MVQLFMTASSELMWAELEARAQRLLEHAKEVPPRDPVRRHGTLLRLWHYPAFGPPRTWTILQPGRKADVGAPTLTRELSWDRDADHQRVLERPDGRHPEPAIALRQSALPAAELEALLAAGSNLAVPVLGIRHAVGVDGEFFGLETYEVSPNVRAQWWCAGPTEWHHFTSWVAELRKFLMRCLDQSG
jgi:hypothetical protein